ncbi:MAG: hypothetical protein R3Y60_06140 [bacterium]
MEFLEIIKKLNVDTKDFSQVYAITLGRVYAVQQALEVNVIKQRNININFKECLVKFGDDEQTFDAQYIGCDADKKVWLWGWNEKTETFPSSLYDLSNQMKKFGEDNEALYCKNPIYDLPTEQFGRFLCGAMTSLFNTCYAVCNTEKGRLFISISNAPEVCFEKVDSLAFVNISKHCLQQNKISHKLFIEGFLLWNGTEYKVDGDTIVAKFEREVTITFKQNGEQLMVEKMDVAAVEAK